MSLNNLQISPRVLKKLTIKHNVTPKEIEECFMNRTKGLLIDTRTQHATFPPTYWFVAQTDAGRTLKVVFIILPDGTYEIKTAYTPDQTVEDLYERNA